MSGVMGNWMNGVRVSLNSTRINICILKTKIQFHFFIHIHLNNKLFILNIFINF